MKEQTKTKKRIPTSSQLHSNAFPQSRVQFKQHPCKVTFQFNPTVTLFTHFPSFLVFFYIFVPYVNVLSHKFKKISINKVVGKLLHILKWPLALKSVINNLVNFTTHTGGRRESCLLCVGLCLTFICIYFELCRTFNQPRANHH